MNYQTCETRADTKHNQCVASGQQYCVKDWCIKQQALNTIININAAIQIVTERFHPRRTVPLIANPISLNQ